MAVRLLFIYLLGDKVMQNLLYMTHMNKPAGGQRKLEFITFDMT